MTPSMGKQKTEQPQTLRAAAPGLQRILRRFWPEIRKHRAVIAGSFLALLGEIVLRLLEPWPLKFIVDNIIAPVAGQLPHPLLDRVGTTTALTLAALAVVVITGLRAMAAYFGTVGFALAGNRVLTEVRGNLYRHVQRLSLAFHTKTKSGDLLTRMTGDISRLQEVTVTAALPLLVNVLTLVGMVGVMLWLNWRLAMLALSVFPLFIFMMTRLSRRIQQVARKERQREGALASSAAEALGAIKVVQALSLENTLEQTFASQNQKSLKEGVKGKRLSAGLERSVDLMIAVGSALVLWYGALLVLGGSMSLGDLLVFITYLKNAFKPMRDLAKYTGRLAKATASGERVVDVLDTVPDIRDHPGAAPAPPLTGPIHFVGVDFMYESGQPILKNLNLEVGAGTRIALVGPSGGGKSTLVSLLLRLYDPTHGYITMSGSDIRGYKIASLRGQIGIVMQESVLFAVSVRENIAFGATGATEREIEEAARLANAHDFIMALPQGYDTILGERGATLSGGQRQRIAIARAAIRRAPIVVLDEPTAGLDNENERDVTVALDRLTEGCTTFLIAHDLRTVQNADLILYVEEGQVVERGTHAELFQHAGKYAAMYRLQSVERHTQKREEELYAVSD